MPLKPHPKLSLSALQAANRQPATPRRTKPNLIVDASALSSAVSHAPPHAKFVLCDSVDASVPSERVIATVGKAQGNIQCLDKLDEDEIEKLQENGTTLIELRIKLGDEAQAEQLAEFARAHSTLQIIIDLAGQPHIAIGQSMRQSTFTTWEAAVNTLALSPNVHFKLNHLSLLPPSLLANAESDKVRKELTDEIKKLWKMYFSSLLEAFGDERLMWGSSSTGPGEQWDWQTSYETALSCCTDLALDGETLDKLFGLNAQKLFA